MLDTPTRPAGPPRLAAVAPEVATELARLLCPDLVEVRGCVLLPWAYEPGNFEAWWERLAGDQAKIEDVLNHLHLWDVFDAGVGDAELHKLARIIAHSWQAAARAKFPERSFEVSVSSNGEDYGPTVYMRSANPVGASDPRLSAASV